MPIELEHTEFLGNTVELIAAEKAGIIKKDIPVLISYQRYKETNEIFINQSKKVETKSIFIDNLIRDFAFSFENFHMNLEVNSSIFSK